jgi:ABC-type multidrug transport system fused ATPase/permease subunit
MYEDILSEPINAVSHQVFNFQVNVKCSNELYQVLSMEIEYDDKPTEEEGTARKENKGDEDLLKIELKAVDIAMVVFTSRCASQQS